MNEIGTELQKLILDNLRQTVPVAAKSASNKSSLVDKSTRQRGYTKILKKGYTP